MLLDLYGLVWEETPIPPDPPAPTGGQIRRKYKPWKAPVQEPWTLPSAPLPQQHVEAYVVLEAQVETTAVARQTLRGEAVLAVATEAQVVGRLDLYAARVAVEAQVETAARVGQAFRAAGALEATLAIEAPVVMRQCGRIEEQVHTLRGASEGVVLNWREEEELLALLEII